jgi:hypothetical protein
VQLEEITAESLVARNRIVAVRLELDERLVESQGCKLAVRLMQVLSWE